MRLHSLPRFVTTAATALALLGGVMVQSPAAHADDWCWNDPVVSINGQLVSINVGVGAATASQIVTQADIAIAIPAGTPASVVSVQTGSFTEVVHFVPSGSVFNPGAPIPVTVAVLITGSNTTNVPTATKTKHKDKTDIATSNVVNSHYSYTVQQFVL